MPTYTMVVMCADGHQTVKLGEFPDDATAIAESGEIVTAQHPSVALSRDREGEMEFLGAWDWAAAGPSWTAYH